MSNWRRGDAETRTGTGRGGRGTAKTAAAVSARVEDYLELTRRHGLTRIEAACRMGITYRTATRYEAILRAQREAA